MFCQNCGSQVADNAKFCQKCGTPLVNDNAPQQARVEPDKAAGQSPIKPPPSATAASVAPVTATTEPKKKPIQIMGINFSLKQLLLGIIVIALAVIGLVSFIVETFGDQDFIKLVKSWKPYKDYGITATCGTVLEKYLSDCTWTQGEFGNGVTYYVNANGKINGDSARMRFEVNMSKPGSAKLTRWVLKSFTLDSVTYEKEDAEWWFENFFDAYEAGFATLSEYFYSFSIDD